MVAQLVQNQKQADSAQTSAAQNELQKLREYCRRLNQALEAERAKTSKLRQYIARFNSTRVQTETAVPAAPPHTDTALQSLIEDQTRLLEQLYSENQLQHSENQKQRSLLSDLEHKIQQLLVANDKLKARNIELRRKLKPMQDSEIRVSGSAPVGRASGVVTPMAAAKLVAVKKTLSSTHQQIETTLTDTKPSDKQRRWFQLPITKK